MAVTNKMNTSLSDIFDVELSETDKPLQELKATAQAAEIDSLEKQREYVKSNLVKLIERGMTAVSDLNTIANSTEKSRDFEVMSGLIKTLVDTNIELLNVEVAHKPKVDLTAGKQEAGTINNNTVFVGSTKDLAKYLSSNSQQDPNVISD
jgi:hypothetical protein